SFSAGDKAILNPWSNAYQAIAYANRILQVIDNVPVGKTTEVTQKNVLKGELLALRAFQHFELYRVYAYSPQYNPNAFAIPYVTGTS
ncbi:RagB/SusD family nutrient uptake outer membrane protein, partial [Salmonella enterica]|uniref:RagB/SusD family nutrient uptake outer membrane protein n=1 Tax=Salmonella enterica TaxID=28901 RepID=UPI003CF2C541